jgi:hypothetical protein
LDVPELLKVRDLLVAKYTKTILPDREIGVYPRLVLKLSMSYPERKLCEKYLEAIADNFGVEWSADVDEEEGEGEQEEEKKGELEIFNEIISKSPTNSQGNLNINSCGSSVDSITSSPISSNSCSHESLPPPPYSEIKAPLPMDYSKQQQQQQQQQQTKQNLPDFDEFTKRFEALRKK